MAVYRISSLSTCRFYKQDTALLQGSFLGPLQTPQPSVSDLIYSQDLTIPMALELPVTQLAAQSLS